MEDNNTPPLHYDITFNTYYYPVDPAIIAAAPLHITGYMSGDMKSVTNGTGSEVISNHVKITSSYRPPRNYMTDRWYQVYVLINQVRYTGRTAGSGMLVKLQKCAQQ